MKKVEYVKYGLPQRVYEIKTDIDLALGLEEAEIREVYELAIGGECGSIDNLTYQEVMEIKKYVSKLMNDIIEDNYYELYKKFIKELEYRKG